MTHFAFAHDFDADPERYWRLFFDEPYNTDLYARLKTKDRTVLVHTEDDATIHFEQKVVPRRDLPGVIKKIVRGDLGYVETATYHKGKSYMDVKIEPTLFRDRTRVRARYTVTALAPGKVRRTFEGDIHVDIPLIGRRVEAAVLEDVKRSYDVAAEVTREWLANGAR
ncbi:MAG TPA: DUF2505 domain-containing protein [Haliangiales bacterium]|nr:DUF2505 domain-containing protein [Haliangiales bacterium]